MNCKNKVKKTRKDVENLKNNWCDDPCWDIETTEGFEEYKEELLEFSIEQKKRWEKASKNRRQKQDEMARSLGLEGLYQLILEQQVLFDKQIDSLHELIEKTRFKNK